MKNNHIEIVPAIDLIGGHCVRLTQGAYDSVKVYGADPLDTAKKFEDAGVKDLHLVDLDGAKNSFPMNQKVLESIASKTGLNVEFGGGIKNEEALKSVRDAGATNAICGSVAVSDPSSFIKWLDEFGSDFIVLGADAKNGLIATHGWLEDSSVKIDELIQKFTPDLKKVICTDISKDGMLKGVDESLYVNLKKTFPDILFTVSGGISGMKDIEKLDALGLRRVIVGKAYYEGFITLKMIEKWSLNE